VLAATAFGAAMGLLVRARGLAPAMSVHFVVNLALLGLWTGRTSLVVGTAACLGLLALAAHRLADGPAADERSPRAA
jgi:membrane protease YdiL (CAAX protease family)